MVTAASKRALGMTMRRENMPRGRGSLKEFYLEPVGREDDLLPVNCRGQDCRKKFFETRCAIPAVFEVEITSSKQDNDQLMPDHFIVKVSLLIAGLPNGGGAVAILRQGLSMWITVLQ
ncbi:hypothetical protein [Caulobacter sp.]|uniref:hypothetical protein n=1 Tax=Caulobacter sp. TaxID=78 RepID=UPI001B1F7CB6|nr:hypothetical protein [Caulobacter sp.]MBO9543395.1 hypothetical protein [Caulobacter sp.]